MMMKVLLYGAVPFYLRILLLMTLSGGALALILLILRSFLGSRISKAAGYWLWKAALLGFLIPFSLFLSLPLYTPVTGMQNAIERTTDIISRQELVVPPETEETAANAALVTPDQSAPAPAPDPAPGLGLGPDSETDNQPSSSVLSDISLETILAAALPAVSVLLALYTVGSYFLFARKLRLSQAPVHQEELQMLQALAPEAKRLPRLCRSALAPTPMLMGVLKPVIYLPDRTYTEEQLNNILNHELTHYRRGDVLLKWCGVLLTCLHWFNPLAWVTRRELDRSCELSCDESVINAFSDAQKQGYGDTLIEMAAQARLPRQVVSTAVCEEKRNLKDRLTAIMESRPFTRGTLFLSALATALALCTVTVLGASQTAGDIPMDSVVFSRSMYFGEDYDGYRNETLPFYNAFPDLIEKELLPDVYTQSLVQLINSYGRKPTGILETEPRRRLTLNDKWIRIDTTDGGYWLLHWSYYHGFSFNPLHFGEDSYETLLTRVDPQGTPVQTWRMDYAFDYAFMNLRTDGTLRTPELPSKTAIRAVVSLKRYCTIEEVSAWMDGEDGIPFSDVFMWTPGETGRLSLGTKPGLTLSQTIDEYIALCHEDSDLAENFTEHLRKLENGEFRIFAVSVEGEPLEVLQLLNRLRKTIDCMGSVEFCSTGYSGVPSKPDGAL